MDRVKVYIDGPNVGRRYDLVKVLQQALAGRPLTGGRYYQSRGATPATEYHQHLRQGGIEVFDVPRRQNKRERVDIQISVDLVAGAYEDAFDVAILVSGDSDFVPAVLKVLERGKVVELAADQGMLAGELRGLGCRWHNLSLWGSVRRR